MIAAVGRGQRSMRSARSCIRGQLWEAQVVLYAAGDVIASRGVALEASFA